MSKQQHLASLTAVLLGARMGRDIEKIDAGMIRKFMALAKQIQAISEEYD